MNNRLTAQIQHAIQYPSGHLDRFASFGPSFEMMPPSGGDSTQPEAKLADIPSNSADQPSAGAPFDARRFVTAGKAIFTIQGRQARYTYRVNESEPDSQGRVCYFVSLLTGPENLSDYTYLGILDVQTGAVRLTRKSRLTDESQPVKAVRWVLARVWAGRSIEPARIYHAGRCGRCGRVLTVPASIESGFGPECAGKVG